MLSRVYCWITTLLLTATCVLFWYHESAVNLMKFLQVVDLIWHSGVSIGLMLAVILIEISIHDKKEIDKEIIEGLLNHGKT